MGLFDKFKDVFKKEDEFRESTVGCDRCGLEFPRSMMTSYGTGSFCGECFGKHKKEETEKETQRKAEARANTKVRFFCYQCKFHFSRKPGFPLSMCPNCGSTNFVPESRVI
jgi:Zn finger protein HypA/HybF involved in hydrogenase expression